MKKTADDSVLRSIETSAALGRKLYWVLLDPDDFSPAEGARIAREAEMSAGVDALLVGGSFVPRNITGAFVKAIKKASSLPVLLFPGDPSQLTGSADALLYLSLVSGRNPDKLIGDHVKAAPIIRRLELAAIPTAYLLIESGKVTAVERISATQPLPRSGNVLAASHALAAELFGMKLVYLEAGSGALHHVPPAMVRSVKKTVRIPLIVGGGIRDAETARKILDAGADIIVTGNMLKNKDGLQVMKEISGVVKGFSKKK